MKKTVMLVDDSMIANFIMKKVISSVDENLNIRDYTDSKEALNILEEVNPTIIFLDLNMPVVDGWHFLDKMLENNLPHKVYILTSSTSEMDRKRSSTYKNVVSFLNKPLPQKEIAAILEVS